MRGVRVIRKKGVRTWRVNRGAVERKDMVEGDAEKGFLEGDAEKGFFVDSS